ncbi:hypothetical protein L195_g018249 [Trifolium pratense]|uniref:Uncharacterized protein n=1 Tax=Trifolium pratense TaxID=57577 RepID=A0A2K3MWA8_TRIPR|nr:hypothetical protein L195_g018249 [Trifolium pratense]
MNNFIWHLFTVQELSYMKRQNQHEPKIKEENICIFPDRGKAAFESVAMQQQLQEKLWNIQNLNHVILMIIIVKASNKEICWTDMKTL